MRISYYYLKLKRSFYDRTFWKKLGWFSLTMIRRPFEVFIGYVTISKPDRKINIKNGFVDHRNKSNHHHSDPNHLNRIIAAYKKSKKAQAKVELPFQIRGLWSEWLSINYQKLIEALEDEDVSTLSSLFENFHREQFTKGLGGYDNFLRYHTLLGKYYLKYVWITYRDKLLSLGYHMREIHFPHIGNPTGVICNGDVISIETLRHVYHAVEMCEILRDIPRATIAEIGAGYGGQAYQTIKMRGELISKYLVFDIPEVAAISSYFLLSAFPDKSICLFGESPVSIASSDKYDIAILPHFAITQLSDSSVDLFYNSNSFSEMDSISAKEYLSIINHACRKYFLHVNHDTVLKFQNPDGSTSVNVIGSDLCPNPVLFKRIFKKPRVHGLPEDRSFQSFEYLYEKVKKE